MESSRLSKLTIWGALFLLAVFVCGTSSGEIVALVFCELLVLGKNIDLVTDIVMS